jgi:hypothetical protein
MAAHTLCSQCLTANRAGLLFCVLCGRRLPRGAFPPDRVTAVAWPGPEVRAAVLPARPSTLAWASLLAAVLAWSVLPVLGAALAVVLALRAHEEARAANGAIGGSAVLRLALWLGSMQLVLGLLAGAAMGAVALVALWRAG